MDAALKPQNWLLLLETAIAAKLDDAQLVAPNQNDMRQGLVFLLRQRPHLLVFRKLVPQPFLAPAREHGQDRIREANDAG